jgi:hypothetical protein
MVVRKPMLSSIKWERRLESIQASQRVEKAVKHFREMEITGKSCTVIEASTLYNTCSSTVYDHLNGCKSHQEAQQSRQLLTVQQEDVLSAWIKTWGYYGAPMTGLTIRAKAKALSSKDVGENWIYRFMMRHPELKPLWANKMDSARANALNPEVVADFYETLRGELVKHGIPPENIFNADEKGIMCGDDEQVKVFVNRNQKTVVQPTQQHHELTTVMECVCADGSAIPPMFIFKGIKKRVEWTVENDFGM